VREYIARRAELLTAVRLPRGNVQENAGTDVVTDLIVLRKRAQELGEEDPSSGLGWHEDSANSSTPMGWR